MKDIAIYGAGGFGREIACLILELNSIEPQWNLIGFFDDGIPAGTMNEYGTVLGGIEVLNDYSNELSLAIAIGKPSTMAHLVAIINNPKISFPNIIAPDLRYLDKNNMSMGKGNLFFSKCSISCNVHIGDFNIFNNSIALGHDVTIGNFNSFMPGTKISGEVTIGNKNFFGVYAIVLQQNKIGNNTTVASASVIIRDTKDGATYIGNPATKFKY
jgi:sugar O-acyltransferase (sialic acid O-acetyltransferase NeuD family)